MHVKNVIDRRYKMRKIIGETYNSNIKQFWCKNCKRSVDVIYKDDKGNSYCDKCLPKESK